MKILLAVLFFAFAFVPVTEAKTVIKTSGNAKVSVTSTVVTSSTNVVTKTCTAKVTTSSNGGGIVVVKGITSSK